jgi:hypothetical protein
MAGEEVFRFTKRKADLPLGAEEEFHRPDKVNFSHPRGSGRVVRARPMQLPIILEDTEDDTDVQEVHPLVPELEPESIPASPPNDGGIWHVNVVEETKVNVRNGTYQDFQRPRQSVVGPRELLRRRNVLRGL